MERKGMSWHGMERQGMEWKIKEMKGKRNSFDGNKISDIKLSHMSLEKCFFCFLG
jgi:hypothetical protein